MSFGLKTAGTGRKDSLSAIAGMQWGAGLGSKPISVVGGSSANMRKESLAGSLMGGMSWGGISVGSWIKEEYVWFPFLVVTQDTGLLTI